MLSFPIVGKQFIYDMIDNVLYCAFIVTAVNDIIKEKFEFKAIWISH